MITGSYADNSITSAKLSKNIGVTQADTVTPAGTTQTLDLNLGNVQVLDLDTASGDVTLTLSNPLKGSRYLIFIIQGFPARDVIWPANVKFPQAQKIIVSTTDLAKDYVEMYFDGTDHLVLNWDLDLK